jgi:hypothetical protein
MDFDVVRLQTKSDQLKLAIFCSFKTPTFPKYVDTFLEIHEVSILRSRFFHDVQDLYHGFERAHRASIIDEVFHEDILALQYERK